MEKLKDKMDLNTLTLNIPGCKVVEIISIIEDEMHYCELLNPGLNT